MSTIVVVSPMYLFFVQREELTIILFLARRQLDYPMRDKPNSIHLSSFFLKEGEDHREAREQIAKAWRHIHRKSRKDLGPRGLFLWSHIFSGFKRELFS